MAKIVLCQASFEVGNVEENTAKIIKFYEESDGDLVVFPELSLSGYSCKDLFLNKSFLDDIKGALEVIKTATNEKFLLVGAPLYEGNKLFNKAIVIRQGEIVLQHSKRFLPSNGIFDEKRYFMPGDKLFSIFNLEGHKIRLVICEDLWHPEAEEKSENCSVTIAINASPFSINKSRKRLEVAESFIKQHPSEYLAYLNGIGGQDVFVFEGGSFVINKSLNNTSTVKWSEGALTLDLNNDGSQSDPLDLAGLQRGLEVAEGSIKQHPSEYLAYLNDIGGQDHFVFNKSNTSPVKWSEGSLTLDLNNDRQSDPLDLDDSAAEDLYKAISLGLKDYSSYALCDNFVIGLSGGIDSALVAVLAADTFGPEKVLCVAMPSKYSSESSLSDAIALVSKIGCKLITLPILEIKNSFDKALFETLGGLAEDEITNENLQPRIRSTLLMAIANKQKRLLLCNSNKSESAVGYTTLYGDMTGAFAPIIDLYKTQVYTLSRWRNKIGHVISYSIIDKEPSAELKPDQKDSDLLPPYSILDRILYDLIEFRESPEAISQKENIPLKEVQKIQKMLLRNEFKRQQSPLGPKVNATMLNKDRRYPICNRYIP